ncbi:MAG: hypothetical protein MJZ93_07005, partial [Paludibacteraceae bacterium]|nr:hypothetical protein [Paludibacteraceae bacterium]
WETALAFIEKQLDSPDAHFGSSGENINNKKTKNYEKEKLLAYSIQPHDGSVPIMQKRSRQLSNTSNANNIA